MREKIYVNCEMGYIRNPDNAEIVLMIWDTERNKLKKHKKKIGRKTNNFAEYSSLVKSLKLARRYTRNTVHVQMDSELVVRQVKGLYRVKAKHLYPLYKKVKSLEANFKKVLYTSVPRSNKFQKEADLLVNKALDGS